MWTTAFVVAGVIAFWDQLPKHRRSRAAISVRSGVNIHSAVYGTGPLDDVDVAERVRQHGSQGFVISVDNNTLGCDPAPGRTKRLEVHYSYLNSVVWRTSRPEYGRMILPEDKQFIEQTAAEYEAKRVKDLADQARLHERKVSEEKANLIEIYEKQLDKAHARERWEHNQRPDLLQPV